MRLGRLALLAMAASLAGNAIAAPIRQADICNGEGRVDKERLAIFALDSAGVSRNPERWARENQQGFEGLSPLQRIIADTTFCDMDGASGGGAPKCAEGDAGKLVSAFVLVQNLLRQSQAFRIEGPATTPTEFFANPQAQLVCLGRDDGSPTPIIPPAITSPLDISRIPLRIRGSTDGLQFRRTDPAFGGLDRATVSFRDDDQAGKETVKVTALVGLQVINRIGLQLLPYFGWNYDRSRRDGQQADTTTDILRLGVLGSHLIRVDGGGHQIVLRPEYSRNRVERSEIITANVAYAPIFNGIVNDAIMIYSGGRSLFSIVPRFELRLNAGHFLNIGNRLPDDSHDYLRVGAFGGFSLLSDIDWLPAELTVTETYLLALSGNPGHLSQLRAVLSLAFDKNKYFGVDLGYVRGRRDDLSPREQVWSIGFGARF